MIERCLWTDTAAGFVPPPAGLPRETDVLVIGGGYTGLAAARALARLGTDVTVCEQGVLGWGASSRNGGFVLAGYKLGAAALLARYGRARARAVYSASLDSVRFLERLVADEGIACDYSRCGHLTVASGPSDYRGLERECRLLAEEFGHETVLVRPGELAGELGSSRFHGGLLDPLAGALHPARYLAGLAAGASAAGARLLERTEVVGIRGPRGAFEVATGAGVVRAREVILASNGYSGPVHPGLRRRVIPIGSYIVATRPVDPAVRARLIPANRVVNDTRHHLVYFRFSPDGRMIFGGRASFSPTPDARAAEILGRALRTTFPDLDVPVEYCWSGKVGFTRDQLPHAGLLDGAHYAAGYCGHGVAMATWLGDGIGRAVAGSDDPPVLAGLPFPGIPLYRGNPWFLPAVGTWFRLRDRLGL